MFSPEQEPKPWFFAVFLGIIPSYKATIRHYKVPAMKQPGFDGKCPKSFEDVISRFVLNKPVLIKCGRIEQICLCWRVDWSQIHPLRGICQTPSKNLSLQSNSSQLKNEEEWQLEGKPFLYGPGKFSRVFAVELPESMYFAWTGFQRLVLFTLVWGNDLIIIQVYFSNQPNSYHRWISIMVDFNP